MNRAADNLDRGDWHVDYEALYHGCGLVDLANRTQIEVAGRDRAAFLHNLCTNEVRKLSPGSGCEAFLTTVQGKTLGHVLLFVGPESIVLSTVAGEGETILKHLDHYLVSEQVTLADRSHQWSELFLGGPKSGQALAAAGCSPVPKLRLAHVPMSLADRTVWIRRVDLAGPVGFLMSMRTQDADVGITALMDAGATLCGKPAFEAARIEWGFPLFGADISDQNLPQEVARDAVAISFVKGCYLGQETVARIDALGHVNKMLVGLRFSGSTIPPPGTEIVQGAQKVGHVTSSAYSPKLNSPVALGYVRRGSQVPGTELASADRTAEVVKLPITD